MKALQNIVSVSLFALSLILVGFPLTSQAEELSSQSINLSPGWNVVSTPRVLSSHSFSVSETSENFDVYVLDASRSAGWATMSDLGQTEFTPLYGYFINNKTSETQTLTFNYKLNTAPNEKLFDRTFAVPGWYSIGVANSGFAITADALYGDTNNPSNILSLLNGSYNLFVDFTASEYPTNRKSVAITDPWDVALPVNINDINDLRETKGYAIYITEEEARYAGIQGTNGTGGETNGATIELKIPSYATENNQLRQITLYDGEGTTDENMIIFKVENESDTDVTLQDFSINLSSEGAGVGEIVSSLSAEGAYSIWSPVASSSVTVTMGDEESITVVFEDLNLKIDAWEEAIIRVKADILPFSGNFDAGDKISVSLDPKQSGWVAFDEYSNPLDRSYSTGVSNAGPYTFIEGSPIVIYPDSESASVTTADGSLNDYATYEIELEVTALAYDVYISTDPNISFDWVLNDGSGQSIASGTRTSVISSSADEEGSYFVINEGETENIRLTVTYSPGVAGSTARLQLLGINFASASTAPTDAWLAIPETDYRTSLVTIVN